MSPPIKVTVVNGAPPCITKPADKVLYGRLCGAITFGLFGSRVNSAPRLCRMKPYPGTVIPEPNSAKLLFTHDTMLPSPSAVDSTMVSPGTLSVVGAAGVDARRGSTRPHNAAACAVDNNFANGTCAKFGSALY